MKNVLDRIVTAKHEEVQAAQLRVSKTTLLRKASARTDFRPFTTCFSKNGRQINIIAEIKRASPSKGNINPGLIPESYAAACEAGGAAALSVLTDSRFFKGGFGDLVAARQSCRLPVLRKDFIVSSYQLAESAAIGADAVLLIVRILTKTQLQEYMHMAVELSLDTLVEIHSEEDLAVAVECGAVLIGINNRNLATFQTDIGTAMRMRTYLGDDQIPVAASGISSRSDIEQCARSGLVNFLVGESIARSEDPEIFVRSLRAPFP